MAVGWLVLLGAAGPMSAAAADLPPSEWDHVARVVVIGDLHGDYGKFHDMLRQAGLIDARDAWSGGTTHLVQLGDVPDRAADTRKIMDLLIRLDGQARRAGGAVHALIGNHEAMNMEGDLRYTTPEEFAAFADRDSERRRDAFYEAAVAALKAKPPAGPPLTFDAAFRAKFDADHPLGWVEHQFAWSKDGVYGRWVLTHPAVIRIDDTLYLHAGIGPTYAAFDRATLNRAVLAALRHEPEAAGGPHDILWADDSPLWYRGQALGEEAAEQPNLAAVLARMGVKQIVIGHTPRYAQVMPRFDGAVIMDDIAAPRGCALPHAFLIKEGETLSVMHRGQRVALDPSDAGRSAYLAAIARLDQAAGCPTG